MIAVTRDIDLQKSYTEEEQAQMLEAYFDARDRNDKEEANRLMMQMPIEPHWARIIRDNYGAVFLKKNFNITDANKEYGEDWLNG